MAKYAMFGRYTTEALKAISGDRTKKAKAIVEKNGGKVEGAYALLGERDLLLLVDLPDTDAAVRTSLALSKLTGIAFSTSPALDASEFDQLAGK